MHAKARARAERCGAAPASALARFSSTVRAKARACAERRGAALASALEA